VIAVIGTSGALAAARLAPFRLYFIIGSVLLLGVGFWMAYRPQGGCIEKVCATRSAKVTRALLWIAVFVTAIAIILPNFVRG
jgi:putative Mn2+ efflux pump MntP